MTNEMFEQAMNMSDGNGFFRARVNFLEGILYSLIDCAEASYSGKTLDIDCNIFTAMLRTFDADAVNSRIEELRKEKENDS